jgi:hypothetical protein
MNTITITYPDQEILAFKVNLNSVTLTLKTFYDDEGFNTYVRSTIIISIPEPKGKWFGTLSNTAINSMSSQLTLQDL